MFHLINNIMDKFAVLCKIGNFKPSVEETFSNVADASAYANIMRRKNDGHEYTVWQLNEELLGSSFFTMFEAMITAEEIGTTHAEVMCEVYGMDACVECALRGKCTLADIYEG